MWKSHEKKEENPSIWDELEFENIKFIMSGTDKRNRRIM